MRKLKLSRHEIEYLNNALFLSATLLYEAGLRSGDQLQEVSLELSDNTAEELRSALTERLAEVGFDIDYKANPEGAFLESLIDRLA